MRGTGAIYSSAGGVAPFAASMSFGGLKQVADLYNETCAKHGKKPGRLMCSYFTHFADTPEQEAAQRARQIRYYKECVIPALPGDPKTALGELDRCLELYPASRLAAENKAHVLEHYLHQPAEALRVLDGVVERCPESEAR